jgi:hypothetical protein
MKRDKMDFITSFCNTKTTKEVNLAKMGSLIYDLVELKIKELREGAAKLEGVDAKELADFEERIFSLCKDVKNTKDCMDGVDLRVGLLEEKIKKNKSKDIAPHKTPAKPSKVRLKQS